MSVAERAQRSGPDRRLYAWIAAVFVLVVFAGFARTYYLKGLFDTPVLPGLVHVHGIVMTVWVLLFVVQVRLVAVRRTNLHRRLGVAGGVLAVVVAGLGVATAIAGARRATLPDAAPSGVPPLAFMIVPLTDMVLFTVLVGAALYLRRRPAAHKRLMLLSAINFMPAGIARIPLGFIEAGGPLAFFGLADLCMLACIAYDTAKHRRLHPAFAWGALLIVASHPLRILAAGTDTWMRFAAWLVG
jgi:uncharacterized membrane protein (DUF485 family)